MSRLRELMDKLCPNGVEYRKLGDVVSVCRGVRVVRAELQLVGKYPVYQNSLIPMGYHDKENCIAGTAFIIGAGAAGDIGYSDVPFWAADDCFYFVCEENMNARFLYHVLLGQETFIRGKVRKASIPRLSRNVVEKVVIPVPPLEIQNEIVKLLDDFTELTAELTEQLMTELTLRKKQYNFYRDSLLNFVRVDDTIVQTDRQTDRRAQRISKLGLWRKTFEIEWKALGEVAYYVRDRIETKNVRVDNYVGVENLLQDRAGRCVADSLPNVHTSIAFTHNDILIGNIRPYLKKIWMANCSGGTNGDVLTIRLNEGEKILHRYLYYTLSSNQFFHYDVTYSKGTKMPRGDKGAVMKYRIPIPPLEVQQKIVSILDRFDALCNDLTSGLSAEIAARKKQYEHYRDKLLTFPRSNG